MHEYSIASNIIEIVEQTVQANDLEKISFIKITIGKMSNVLPEALQSAYKILVENTPLRQSYLTLEVSPMIIICNECDSNEITYDFIFNCSNCSGSNLTVQGGDDLKISEITLN